MASNSKKKSNKNALERMEQARLYSLNAMNVSPSNIGSSEQEKTTNSWTIEDEERSCKIFLVILVIANIFVIFRFFVFGDLWKEPNPIGEHQIIYSTMADMQDSGLEPKCTFR